MINPAMRSSPVRMMGLSSGMDTDFIIQNAMRAHQFRIDNKIRQRTLIEWRQQTHNSIRDQLREFQSTLMSMTSPRSMFSSNQYNTHVAQLSRNNSGISITTRASSAMGSFEIRSVNSLAQGARITSASRVSGNNQGLALNTRLGNLNLANGASLNFNHQDTITLGSDTFTREFVESTEEGVAGSWVFRQSDGSVIDFEDHAFLSGGVATIGTGEDAFQVTRLANGNLARVADPINTRLVDGARVILGHGNERTTVTINYVPGEENNPGTWQWSIPGIGEGATDITGTFDFSGTGPIDLVSQINDRIDYLDRDMEPLEFTPVNITMGADGNPTIASDRAGAAGNIAWGENIEPVIINGHEVRLNRNMTINDMIRTINNDARLNVTISYDQISDRFTIQSNTIGEDSSVTVSGLEALGIGRTTNEIFSPSINSREFTGTGPNAQTVRVTRERNEDNEWVYRFAIQGNDGEFGELLDMVFDDTTGNVTNPELLGSDLPGFALNANGDLIDSNRPTLTSTGTQALGSTSSITIWDGRENITIEGGTRNSVDFGGVTINFNTLFDSINNATDEAVVVDITRNVDQAFENITNFINSYNAIISRVEGLLRERRTQAERSYMPLTDEEKQGMTERQIEQWEEIARRGLMRNDTALENLARELRSSFFSEIEGLGMRPSDLGLTTGNFFDGTGGQIFINEERLRAALEEDPDRVMSVFTQQGDTRAQQGLVTRINSVINGFVSAAGTQSNTLRGLERSIRNVNEQIERMTVRMFAEEDRLFRQFSAMERAMSQLQSQGDWFNAMLGSMG